MEKNITTLEINNDLDLSLINLPDTAIDSIIPEELNSYLRDQLYRVTKQNEDLKHNLSTIEAEKSKYKIQLKELGEKIKEYEGICNKNEFISSTQLSNSKVVELTKKLREKNAENESLKSKTSRLEKSLSELIKEKESLTAENECKESSSNEEDPENDLKRLQTKLNHTTNKLLEVKNSNFKLKQDLKLSNKWLQQEIGDNFESILSLNNTNTNWRGRAQIICDLQQKNAELKEKLKENSIKNTNCELCSQRKALEKKISHLQKDYLEIKNNFDDLKRKFDASKARNKVLENENITMKSKISMLAENGERDQQMIASLTAQISGRNNHRGDEIKIKEQTINKLRQENELLKIEAEKHKCNLSNHLNELEAKEEEIDRLRRRIRSSRPQSSYNQRHENPEIKKIGVLEAEKLKLLELTEIQTKRLDEEREVHQKTQQQLRFERQRGAKLEASVARLEIEQTSARSSYRNSKSKPEPQTNEQNIRDQLELAEENIKALTTRLEIECYERKKDLQEFAKILKNYDLIIK